MSEKIERQLPTGIGGERLKKDVEELPAVEVDNEVSWVNDKINLPFDLKVGQSSRLGMFLTPNETMGGNIYWLEISGSHTRSGILGRVIFNDKEGRLYRDIDLKGVGYNNFSRVVKVQPDRFYYSHSSDFASFSGTTGIVNQELIQRDIDFSEKFLKAGIRTHRVMALIELKEIIDEDGKKISIAEAKGRQILSEKDEPVIEVRAFGTKSRLHDAIHALQAGSKEKGLKLLLDAKMVVAQEMGIDPDKFSFDDYFKWLVEITATNVARMRYNKWISGYLSEHNITLDGRIVDLDSVEVVKEGEGIKDNSKKTFEKDRDCAFDSLAGLRAIARVYQILSNDQEHYVFYRAIYDKELARLQSGKVPRVRS